VVCELINSSSPNALLRLIRSVTREELETPHSVVYQIECTSCDRVHSHEVDPAEYPPAALTSLLDVLAWNAARDAQTYKRAA